MESGRGSTGLWRRRQTKGGDAEPMLIEHNTDPEAFVPGVFQDGVSGMTTYVNENCCIYVYAGGRFRDEFEFYLVGKGGRCAPFDEVEVCNTHGQFSFYCNNLPTLDPTTVECGDQACEKLRTKLDTLSLPDVPMAILGLAQTFQVHAVVHDTAASQLFRGGVSRDPAMFQQFLVEPGHEPAHTPEWERTVRELEASGYDYEGNGVFSCTLPL